MPRIITGKHQNRVIPTLKNADYRPSSSRLREALFSILASGEFAGRNLPLNAHVLDLFAGTGSLAFEALSRGAKNATLIDINADYLETARKFATKIGEINNMNFLQKDATNLPVSTHLYNLVFMDPPYYKDIPSRAVNSLIEGNWLKNEAIIVVELAKTDNITPNKLIRFIKERVYGNNKIMFLQYTQSNSKTGFDFER